MAVYIGTSGWSYDHWVDILYPKSASSLERLDAYARRFRTVEVNNTFYRWPEGRGVLDLARALARGVRLLGQGVAGPDPVPQAQRSRSRGSSGWSRGCPAWGRSGACTLFQLPPHFPRNLDRLDRFLDAVPSGHRLAVEFRHPTWNCEETFAILERHGTAYCVMSGANLPVRAPRDGGLRLRPPPRPGSAATCTPAPTPRTTSAGGPTGSASGGRMGRDIYAYFNNDGHGHAVRNALRLRELTGE